MEQNLNLYQVFYEVAGCRNFSLAAKKLYITQPAVSKAISRLEETLETTLFHRSSRGVRLTREGELLYRHVAQAFHTLKSGEEQLRLSVSGRVRHLSIGVSTMLCKYILLPVMKGFMEENPSIKITISCQSTLDTLALLQEGRIDLGLVGIPTGKSSEKSQGVLYFPLRTIEDIFVATDAFLAPFSERYKGKSQNHETFLTEILTQASFILLNRENISRRHVDAFLTQRQLVPENVIEVNNMDLSIEFARAGLGIACVIRDFVERDLKEETLLELKLGHKIPPRQIGFAYPAKEPASGAAQELIAYCREFEKESS